VNFEWSKGQQELFQSVVQFASDELTPGYLERDDESRFERSVWEKAAEFGLAGLPFQQEFGGKALGALDTILAVEAMGYGCLDGGLVFSLCAHMFTCGVPIWKAGSDEQRRDLLAPLAAGKYVGGNASTEPEGGSDVFSLNVTAELKGDHYVLNGRKSYVSNGPVADVLVVYATVDKSQKLGGVTAFILTRDCPGWTVVPKKKTGLRTSPIGELYFDNCRVPVGQRLGPEGAGGAIFTESMRWERACLFASYTGAMQRQLERSIGYAKERQQFGQPIGKFQSVSNRIVDMKVRLDASRLLLYRAGWLLQQGKRCDMEISISKLFISESAVLSGLDSIQIHGGAGCMTENGIEQELRNAVPSRIFSGTSEIQRMVIARHLGL
jgi:L-prolyl-PCP dehydrogenase